MMDAPKDFSEAVSRFKHRPYLWACDECFQPLAGWHAHNHVEGSHWCGSVPVWGYAPRGVHRCASCYGRRHWTRWACTHYGITRKQARRPE